MSQTLPSACDSAVQSIALSLLQTTKGKASPKEMCLPQNSCKQAWRCKES